MKSFLEKYKGSGTLFEWWERKKQIEKIREELPTYISSLRWLLEHYPVQVAITLPEFDEISKLMKNVEKKYKSGMSFKKALYSEIPKEFEDFIKRLVLIYNTGKGEELLDLYSDKLMSQNLVRIKKRSARMQIFSIAYTSFAAILPVYIRR